MSSVINGSLSLMVQYLYHLILSFLLKSIGQDAPADVE